MAIEVTMGVCGDFNNVLNKSVDWTNGVITTAANFRDAAEFHAPEFTVAQRLSAQFNYCMISGFDGKTRYYYAEVTNLKTDLSLVTCRLDVLMTYADSIKEIKVAAKRLSLPLKQSEYVFDSQAPIETRRGFSDMPDMLHTDMANPSGDMILVTVG